MAKRFVPKQTQKFQQQLPKLYCGPGPVCKAVSSEACNAIATILRTGNSSVGLPDDKQDQSTPVLPDMLEK